MNQERATFLRKAVELRARQYRSVMLWTGDMATRGVPEHWRDDYDLFEMALSVDAAINGIDKTVVKCDCENFSMGLEHYCHIDLNVLPELLSLHCVDTRRDTKGINHCVGGIEIEGVLYIWDNAQPYPFYSYASAPRDYTFIQHATYDKPTEWYKSE